MTIILSASNKPRRSKKILLIECCTDGPWVPVIDVSNIIITGATDADVIEILRRNTGFLAQRDPILFQGSGTYPVIIPRGDVKIRRVKGNAAITVYAERISC